MIPNDKMVEKTNLPQVRDGLAGDLFLSVRPLA